MGYVPDVHKAFEVDYDYVIVVQEDDGSYALCKPNYHRINNFGPGEGAFMQATGHGHGIAYEVVVECDDPRRD